jgi:hypothetical protein
MPKSHRKNGGVKLTSQYHLPEENLDFLESVRGLKIKVITRLYPQTKKQP